jgi:hypothetical protein
VELVSAADLVASVETCLREAVVSLPSKVFQVEGVLLSQSRPRPSLRTARGLPALRRPLSMLMVERLPRSQTK